MFSYDLYENIEELYENLEHFRQNYYERATLQSHVEYILKINSFRKNNNGEYPTKKQLYLMFRNNCFCRYYIENEDIYVLAADFFMKNTGNITNLSCSNVYYFFEFYTIERRSPQSLYEFNLYIANSIMSIFSPSTFFTSETPSNPLNKSKLQTLKDKIFTFTYSFKGKDEIKDDDMELCSICQDNIEDNQKCIRLDCGHYFHGDTSDCCENGNIFKWFETHDSCPLCRTKL
jgi:hypothetical protein